MLFRPLETIFESSLTLATWITSDSHWSHDNIRVYQNRPMDHFSMMWLSWNARVRPDDMILHLGDLVYGGDRSRHTEWLDGLSGNKYLLKGNHDKHSNKWYEAAGFTVIGRKPFYWVAPDGRLICFSHEPETEDEIWDINIHGHIHDNDYWPGTRRKEDRRNVCVEKTQFSPVRLGDLL